MTPAHGVLSQLSLAQTFTRMALKGLSDEQWRITPPVLLTNVNWQFGHVLLAHYSVGVRLTVGDRPGLIDFETYRKCYGRGSSPSENWELRPDKAALIEAAGRLDAALAAIAGEMGESDWAAPVSTFVPGVTDKLSALLFCGSHQMYHNGQLGLLRKALMVASGT